jgi:hypothetical protein
LIDESTVFPKFRSTEALVSDEGSKGITTHYRTCVEACSHPILERCELRI